MEIVVKENSQIRIDKYLMMMQDISRSKLQKMIDNLIQFCKNYSLLGTDVL